MRASDFKYSILIIFVIFFRLFSQTTEWRLIWDKNQEADMSYYKIYRSTSSPAETLLDTLHHKMRAGNDTIMVYMDSDIEKGIQYFYRVKAVDLSGVESDFSEEISAAIPRISDSFPDEMELKSDTVVSFNYRDYVTDPDNNKSELTCIVEKDTLHLISVNNQTGLISIQTPDPFVGEETVRFEISDPDSFYDAVELHIFATSIEPQIQLPEEVSMLEDDTLYLDLKAYDPDTPHENLYWQGENSEHVFLTINNITHQAKIYAAHDWYGEESVLFKLRDVQDGSDSAYVLVRVVPVNDPPVLVNLPNVDLSLSKTKQIDLNNYVQDVDTPKDRLEWTFSGNQDIQISVSEQNVAQFSAPDGWAGTEQVQVTVKDDSLAQDETTILVYSQDLTKAPVLTVIDSVVFDEDTQKILDLSGEVTDPDNDVTDLKWTFSTPEQLTVEFDSENLSLTLTPQENWFGVAEIAMKVEDPDGNFDFDTLKVKVQSVNDLPAIKKIPDVVFLSSSIYILDLKPYISDNDGLDDIDDIAVIGGENSLIGKFVDKNNFEVVLFSPPNYQDQQSYLLQVSDKQGAKASRSFLVRVLESNLNSKVTVYPFGNTSNILLKWKTMLPTKDVVEYGTSQEYGQQLQVNADLNIEHEVLLQNLKPQQTYHFRIVSTDSNGITFTTKDSTFTTGMADNSINVFPIPYRMSHPEDGPGIYFTNLPDYNRLFIYNLLGELVYFKEKAGHIFLWDVKNNAGKQVHSGVYLYVIKGAKNKKLASGKILIIR